MSPINLSGSCYCGKLTYEITLSSPGEARTSLCHCQNCKRAFTTPFGLTTKLPLHSFRYTTPPDTSPTLYTSPDSGVTREFCSTCGTYICEYGQAARGEWRYVCTGTMKGGKEVMEGEVGKPRVEFFVRERVGWLQEVRETVQKWEIKQ